MVEKEENDPQVKLMAVALIWAVIVFFGSWWYAINEYGWFLGLSLGWIPALILSLMVCGVAWTAYVYIPENSPGFLIITYLVSIVFGVGLTILFLYGVFIILMSLMPT